MQHIVCFANFPAKWPPMNCKQELRFIKRGLKIDMSLPFFQESIKALAMNLTANHFRSCFYVTKKSTFLKFVFPAIGRLIFAVLLESNGSCSTCRGSCIYGRDLFIVCHPSLLMTSCPERSYFLRCRASMDSTYLFKILSLQKSCWKGLSQREKTLAKRKQGSLSGRAALFRAAMLCVTVFCRLLDGQNLE